MSKPYWQGVFPAVTTKFTATGALDHEANGAHIEALVAEGVHGIIVTGTLGENSSLSAQEKLDLVAVAVAAVGGKVPVLAGVAEPTTERARHFAQDSVRAGAKGLMVLPPVSYCADQRETTRYLMSVADAGDCPIMLYNNPITYGIDINPEMFAQLAKEERFVAIKEASDDVRRLTDIANLLGDRYALFCGVDNLAMESLLLGAHGWVAGLVGAFPRETLALVELIRAGRVDEARDLYRWFFPLLHLDVSTKLVQNIKLAETMTGMGSEYVREPRLDLTGEERNRVIEVIAKALRERPVFG